MATIASSSSLTQPRLLRAALWTAQVLLATTFAAMGIIKLVFPMERLVESMSWMESAPSLVVRLIGLCELAGAIAIMLPHASRTLGRTVFSAAVALIVLMTLAGAMHLFRGEYRMLPINLALAGLAAFVAWGRHARADERAHHQR